VKERVINLAILAAFGVLVALMILDSAGCL